MVRSKVTVIILYYIAFGFSLSMLSQNLDILNEYGKNPKIRAFLDTIAYAEGTSDPEGYRTLYTYAKFDSFKDHPRQRNCAWYKGSMLCSTAAGRYQFLQRTWDRLVQKIGVPDFSPESQDKAAILLLAEHNALDDIKAGRISDAIERVKKIWSSLPGSPYGQPTRTLKELLRVYKERLSHYQRLRSR
ncbi:MAG TPA: glycoside hydrolase family 104 protein [Candidatus Babeliaceae bacterium]|nr:glycoside hydrolase family 104 protein [Candidatus Babeliaceae bacterium]